jgi:hypothetical protein
MPGNAPTVMVSSTFYDLGQVRSDLMGFLQNELGYSPLLSEFSSFPVDPDVDTIENCRRRVEQNADVLVLIIGGRYGSVDSESGKSITSIEYVTARAKGVPIDVFIDKRILAVLPVWARNRDGDFSDVVDSNELFTFVEQVRNTDRVWTHEFERAQDITNALRFQFAHLMHEGLQGRMRLQDQPLAYLEGLHGKALRLALERPWAWEYRLFGQVLSDEVAANADLRREHRLGIVVGASEYIPSDEILRWIRAQTNELSNLMSWLDTLVNVALQEALRAAGTSEDATDLIFVAKKIASGYQNALEWAQRVRRAHVEDQYQQLLREMSYWTDDVIEKLETFGPDILRQIQEAIASPPADGVIRIEVSLVLKMSNIDRYNQELRRVFAGVPMSDA